MHSYFNHCAREFAFCLSTFVAATGVSGLQSPISKLRSPGWRSPRFSPVSMAVQCAWLIVVCAVVVVAGLATVVAHANRDCCPSQFSSSPEFQSLAVAKLASQSVSQFVSQPVFGSVIFCLCSVDFLVVAHAERVICLRRFD